MIWNVFELNQQHSKQGMRKRCKPHMQGWAALEASKAERARPTPRFVSCLGCGSVIRAVPYVPLSSFFLHIRPATPIISVTTTALSFYCASSVQRLQRYDREIFQDPDTFDHDLRSLNGVPSTSRRVQGWKERRTCDEAGYLGFYPLLYTFFVYRIAIFGYVRVAVDQFAYHFPLKRKKSIIRVEQSLLQAAAIVQLNTISPLAGCVIEFAG